MDIPWSRIALSASQPGMRLADPALQDSNRPMFTAAINPESASKFLAGSGHTFADLLALANAGKPLPRFSPDRSDACESLHENRVRLRRSVLFLVVCAEEKGLLGSRYYAAKPTVPRNVIVADLNTDMFLPLFSLNYFVVYGGEESTLGRDLGEVAAPLDIHTIPDRQPDRNIFIRSDQYNFIRAGVPSIMPAFGSLEGSPEAKTQSEWLKNRYHAPSDDGDQPVDLVAAAKFNQLMVNLTEKVANEHERRHWNETSFFKKFATN
jgi:Zn-dependent M28 family amino/carboxypeptidase